MSGEKNKGAAEAVGPFAGGHTAPDAFTAEDLNAWHKARLHARGSNVVPKFVCADGFEISIQASSGHYCSPREDKAWPYTHFELGYPTAADEEIATYAETKDSPLSTVYGWVPVSNILLVINKHGGPIAKAES